MTSLRSLRPQQAPFLATGTAYVSLHVALVAVSAIVSGGDPTLLTRSGISILAYFALTAAFGGTLSILGTRSLSRRWVATGVVIGVAVVAVRLSGGSVPGTLAVSSVFVVVFAPYLVAAGVLLRFAVVRIGPVWLRQRPHATPTAVALFLVGVLLLTMTGTSLVAVATAPPAVPPSDWDASRQLEHLERTDQNDRETGAFIDRSRDYRRAERVLDLLAADRIDTPADKLHAAVVLQHGTCPAHFELAHRLAVAANESPSIEATRWVHVTYDRWQVSMGNEQKYGTQSGTRPVNDSCQPPVPEQVDVSAPRSLGAV